MLTPRNYWLARVVDCDDGWAHIVSHGHCDIIACERQPEHITKCITELGPDVCESERESDDADSDGRWRDVRSIEVFYYGSPD